MAIPGGGFLECRGLNAQLCAEIIAELEAGDWEAARVFRPDQPTQNVLDQTARNCLRLGFSSDFSAAKELWDLIGTTIIPDVVEHWRIMPDSVSPIEFLKYPEGGFFSPHRDVGPGFQDRLLTIVGYLNADFLGGELEIHHPVREVIVPRTGRVVAFPSDYVHASRPIARGTKRAFVVWCLKKPVQDWL
ncbi:2OG-Fe(II) oxygenase [Sinorhizobium meliloti]|uniref:2OG-Fe(II) oxygenase n=1 Tax=Rhizobium meliloti TaxID=382 RepID=UPI0018E71C7A|nr:2OG-Fe(II) oxygenase [Sinorhizobium meliloti]QQF06280.1 2OG-Fe(II) oxygenase [Sinorhizobium meliloti]